MLHVGQCIYTLLFFTACFLLISVSTPFYPLRSVTCRSVYLHFTILYSVLSVEQFIYTVLFFTLYYL